MPSRSTDANRDPETMTADERREEIAGSPARGFVRAVETASGSKSGSIGASSGPLGPVGWAALRWLAGEDA